MGRNLSADDTAAVGKVLGGKFDCRLILKSVFDSKSDTYAVNLCNNS